MTHSVERRAIRGFTMIELLIALVLTGILGTLIFDFMLGQGRFGARQAALQEVQQNARGALELISSELRGVPPGSVTSAIAETNQLSFRSPIAWAVLCDVSSASQPILAFPESTVPSSDDLTGEWGLDVPAADDPSTPTHDNPNGRVVHVPADRTVGLGPAVNCPNAGAGAEYRQLPLDPSLPLDPRLLAGTPVFLYETVTYDVAKPSAMPTEWWLRRNTQPLAGPLTGEDGFKVKYNPDGPAATSATDVARALVTVSALSRGQVDNGKGVVDTDSMVVFLRNRNY